MMLIKIAWRNVWRNKVRSGVVIAAIAVGLWAGVFASAFVVGMMNQKIDSIIRMEMSHFQVHHPEFREDMLPKYIIPDGNEKVAAIRAEAGTVGVSGRVIAMPMLSSAKHAGAIKVTGVDPEAEAVVTTVHQHVKEGQYFEGVKRNPILISRKTAEKYQVKLRSRMVLDLQAADGEMLRASFRVVGIYDTDNQMYDEMNAFVRKSDLQALLGIGTDIHEIAVLLSAHEMADPTAAAFQEKWPEDEVQPWIDLSSGMRFIVEAQDTYTLVIVGIILVALLFSIVNAMLMAVLERVREIGMLMAVGMTKRKVFGMVMLETVFLALVGGPLGLLLSWACIAYFGAHGIHLDGAAYGEVGFGNVVYPELEFYVYLQVTAMVLGMAVFAAIFPARKALRLVPVEAIRKI